MNAAGLFAAAKNITIVGGGEEQKFPLSFLLATQSNPLAALLFVNQFYPLFPRQLVFWPFFTSPPLPFSYSPFWLVFDSPSLPSSLGAVGIESAGEIATPFPSPFCFLCLCQCGIFFTLPFCRRTPQFGSTSRLSFLENYSAGAVGIESAGEIATLHKDKKVTIVQVRAEGKRWKVGLIGVGTENWNFKFSVLTPFPETVFATLHKDKKVTIVQVRA